MRFNKKMIKTYRFIHLFFLTFIWFSTFSKLFATLAPIFRSFTSQFDLGELLFN